MTEEQKQKMADGRAKARLARKEAQSTEHLAAGKDRDEQRAINTDALAQEQEKRETEAGIEAVDRTKLKQQDNEIQRHVRRRDKSSGIPVEDMEPGYRYAWLTNAMTHGDQARANIRQQLSDAKSCGYVPVQGEDATGKKYEGGDGVSGTSLRGVGDVFLHKIREDDYRETLKEDREKAQRQGAVEDRSVVFARDRLGRHGLPNTMHNIADPNDRFMTQRERVLGTDAFQSKTVTATTFTEGDIRRGSMHGPTGETLKPGFERRT